MHILSNVGRRALGIGVLLFAVLVAMVAPIAQASETLEVQIANVTLKIDGQEVQNLRSKYPVLLYHEITYFPITYHYMQALGLQSSYEAEKGLSVATNPKGAQKLIQDLLPAEAADQVPGTLCSAIIPSFPITVQGKAVKAQGDWPFLLYNEITYMPATWDYMVTTMGLKLDYEQSTKTLSLSGYTVPSSKITLADISALPKIFTSEIGGAQKLGMSSKITVTTAGYGNVKAASMHFNYDGIVDSGSGQVMFTLAPDTTTADLLKIEGIQMYTRPEPNDANRMQLFSLQNGAWKPSSADNSLTPDLFTTKAASKEDAAKLAENLDRMGLSTLATAVRNPSAANYYSLYKNFVLQKTDGNVALIYQGGLKTLLEDIGVASDANLGRFFGYVLSIDNVRDSSLTRDQLMQIRGLLENSSIQLRSTYDSATGQLTAQSLTLDLKLSATDGVATIEMNSVFNYDPALNWPTIK